MSYDRYSILHYLTLQGWSSKEEPPNDRVETWEEDVDQPSGFGPETSTWSLRWHDPNVSESDRTALRARYPRPERKLSQESLNAILKKISN